MSLFPSLLLNPSSSQTVTPAKLNDPLFKFGLLDEHHQHVCHLDLSGEIPDDPLFDCAAAFSRLPNLCEVTFAGIRGDNTTALKFYTLLAHGEDFLDSAWQDLEDLTLRLSEQKRAYGSKLVRRALLTLAKRISHIRIVESTPGAALVVLEHFASPTSLRQLEIKGNFWEQSDIEWAKTLQAFSLVELKIDQPYQAPVPLLPSIPLPTLHLPILTALSLHMGNKPAETVRFIESTAPNVQYLELYDPIRSHLDGDVVFAAKLPHLQHLSFKDIIIPPSHLEFFTGCPLRTLAVDVVIGRALPTITIRPTTFLSLPALEPFATLRRVQINLSGFRPPADLEDYRSELAARGVVLDFRWRNEDELALCTDEDAENILYDQPRSRRIFSRKQQADAIEHTLEWALSRVRYLRGHGDERGVEELADALHWVRQRQVIEEQ